MKRRGLLLGALLGLLACGGGSWQMQKPDIDVEVPKASDLEAPSTDGSVGSVSEQDCALVRRTMARPNGCSATCPCASGENCCSSGDDPMGMCVKGSCSSR